MYLAIVRFYQTAIPSVVTKIWSFHEESLSDRNPQTVNIKSGIRAENWTNILASGQLTLWNNYCHHRRLKFCIQPCRVAPGAGRFEGSVMYYINNCCLYITKQTVQGLPQGQGGLRGHIRSFRRLWLPRVVFSINLSSNFINFGTHIC